MRQLVGERMERVAQSILNSSSEEKRRGSGSAGALDLLAGAGCLETTLAANLRKRRASSIESKAASNMKTKK